MPVTTAAAPIAPAGEHLLFDAIGTRWRITTDRPLARSERQRVDATVRGFDRTWSRFRDDSAVAALAETGGPADLGPTAPALLGLLGVLRDLTAGAMDPFVAASLAHLGYGPAVDLRPHGGHLPAPRARWTLDGTVARVAPPAMLDVGAAGKGQLVDLVAADLADLGHERAVVDASGDLAVRGTALRVALEHPFDPESAIGVVTIRDAAIAGSAVNRRAWTHGGRRLHHVLDARTGRPVETVAATWALAATAMEADALATALFLVEPAALAARFAFEWVRVTTDGRATASAALPGELFR